MTQPEKTYLGKRRIRSKSHINLNPDNVTWGPIDVPAEFLKVPERESYSKRKDREYREKKRLKNEQ